MKTEFIEVGGIKFLRFYAEGSWRLIPAFRIVSIQFNCDLVEVNCQMRDDHVYRFLFDKKSIGYDDLLSMVME